MIFLCGEIDIKIETERQREGREREQEQKPDPFVFYFWMLSWKDRMSGAAAAILHPEGSLRADPGA